MSLGAHDLDRMRPCRERGEGVLNMHAGKPESSMTPPPHSEFDATRGRISTASVARLLEAVLERFISVQTWKDPCRSPAGQSDVVRSHYIGKIISSGTQVLGRYLISRQVWQSFSITNCPRIQLPMAGHIIAEAAYHLLVILRPDYDRAGPKVVFMMRAQQLLLVSLNEDRARQWRWSHDWDRCA